MAGKKQDLEWLIDPDPNANQIIWTELNAESVIRGIMCQDGVSRDLWPCPRTFPRKLCKNPDLTVGKDFRIFNRTVNGRTTGKPKDVTFLFKGGRWSPVKKKKTRRSNGKS